MDRKFIHLLYFPFCPCSPLFYCLLTVKEDQCTKISLFSFRYNLVLLMRWSPCLMCCNCIGCGCWLLSRKPTRICTLGDFLSVLLILVVSISHLVNRIFSLDVVKHSPRQTKATIVHVAHSLLLPNIKS